jgi:hypothetical protein
MGRRRTGREKIIENFGLDFDDLNIETESFVSKSKWF